ncbi:unnamed protein product, partial [Ceratitis capitata]
MKRPTVRIFYENPSRLTHEESKLYGDKLEVVMDDHSSFKLVNVWVLLRTELEWGGNSFCVED